MASSAFSVQDALDALKTPGFYYANDQEVGQSASEPFEDIDTDGGHRFYLRRFLKDNRISDVLRKSLGPCKLVAYRTFTPDPTRIFQFRRGGAKADCILVVLLWPPESKVIVFGDSLQHDLFAVDSDNGLWRVPQAAANTAGCGQGTPVYLEHGGLAIQDGRTLLTFVAGKPIAATFASNMFLTKWRWNRRRLSTTYEMRRRLKDSEDKDFGLHVQFNTESSPEADDRQ